MLEEGLAVWFSINGPLFLDPKYKARATNYIDTNVEAKPYREALQLYNEAQSFTASQCVRDVRKLDSNLQNVSPTLLLQACPLIPASLAERLCERVRLRP
jgi:hypothetical protein